MNKKTPQMYFLYMLVPVILFVSFCGCKNIETSSSSSNSSAIISPSPNNTNIPKAEEKSIPFNFNIVGTSEESYNKFGLLSPCKCRSMTELSSYSIINQRYNDEFFQNNTLALIFKKDTSGSIKHSVKEVLRIGGSIYFGLDKTIPRMLTADMSYRCIIVEIENKYLEDNDCFTLFKADLSHLNR